MRCVCMAFEFSFSVLGAKPHSPKYILPGRTTCGFHRGIQLSCMRLKKEPQTRAIPHDPKTSETAKRALA